MIAGFQRGLSPFGRIPKGSALWRGSGQRPGGALRGLSPVVGVGAYLRAAMPACGLHTPCIALLFRPKGLNTPRK
jgi:hypothetical protein